MKGKVNKRILANIIIPLLVGGIMYYLISPDVIFVKKIDSVLGCSLHWSGVFPCIFVRNYLLDMLWAYALVFAVYGIIHKRNNKKMLIYAGLMVTPFVAIMEVLQMTAYVNGTFDMLDIVVELVAEFIGLCNIYYITRGGN